jgi:hypothetical protein
MQLNEMRRWIRDFERRRQEAMVGIIAGASNFHGHCLSYLRQQLQQTASESGNRNRHRKLHHRVEPEEIAQQLVTIDQ